MSATADELIEQVGDAVEEGTIPLRIHNDPEIHRRELERVFGRSWVFVGHESEIPEPGDYALRYIGQDPFIFVRDEHGDIRVLFDSCRHRGTRVCRADQGNASHFRCPYHGWVYKNTGELVNIPHTSEHDDTDEAEWGLLAASGVDTYRGLVFATVDDDAPPLAEYLGGMRWYLDMELGLADGGMEVVAEPHRWEIDANWKTGADNFSGDTDHTQTAHRSIFEVGLFGEADLADPHERYQYIHHVTDCDGHAMSVGMQAPEASIFFGYPESAVSADGITDEQFDIARRSFLHFGTVFPNLSFIHVASTASPDKPDRGYLSLRQWQPKAPGTMEMWNWVLVPKDASEQYRREAYNTAVNTFGPSGNFEEDDLEIWNTITTSAGSVFADRPEVTLNYRKGLDGLEPVDDWPGPGTVYNDWLEEGVMRTFYDSWYRYMRPDGPRDKKEDGTGVGPESGEAVE